MLHKTKIVDESLFVPVKLLIWLATSGFSVALGLGVWSANLSFKDREHDEKIQTNLSSTDELQKQNRAALNTLHSIDKRLSRIEGKLGVRE